MKAVTVHWTCDSCGKTVSVAAMSNDKGSEVRPLPTGWAALVYHAHPFRVTADVCSVRCAERFIQKTYKGAT